MSTAGVILAAGGGSRFDGAGHKLLTGFRGRALVSWAISAALGAGLDEVAVVAGAVDLSGETPAEVSLIDNTNWATGQASSLQAALSWARGRGHDSVVVGLGDQPLVPSSAWAAVAASDCAIAIATFGGERRPPVRLERSVWDLCPTTGDEGARVLMRQRPDLVCEVVCDGQPADIDNVEDLDRWN
jgi:CTP:molybdopterin cytidylyltransferase MocA